MNRIYLQTFSIISCGSILYSGFHLYDQHVKLKHMFKANYQGMRPVLEHINIIVNECTNYDYQYNEKRRDEDHPVCKELKFPSAIRN